MPLIRNREISRLEAFTDAVFAFAATLLVVSLEVPQDFDALVSQLYGFVAFAVTFGALVAIWTIHNAYFRRYSINDGWITLLNSVLLFVVLFYVFPLKFLADSFFGSLLGIHATGTTLNSEDDLARLFVLYSLGFCAVFCVIALMYWHAWRSCAALRLNDFQTWEAAYLARHYLLFALIGLLTIVAALLGLGLRYGAPGMLYFLLGPLCWGHGVWSERFRPDPGETAH